MRLALPSLASGTLLVLLPTAAWAHPGRAPEPHDLWSAWTFAPTVLLGLAASAWLYGRGWRALRRRAGRGRVVGAGRAAAFAASLAVLFIALVSPVDAVASALFAVHMLQHLLLIMVAAPLLVLGAPLVAIIWAVPLSGRKRIARWWRRAWVRRLGAVLRSPPAAWSLHVAVLWLWHVPQLYDLAMRRESLHVVEHVSFFLTALFFWWSILAPHGRRMSAGAGVLYLFAAALQCTFLGALITFARRPWYTAHFGTTAAWGLNPLEDQQLAGLLMWIPAGTVYLVVLLPLLWRALDPPGGKPRRLYRAAPAGASARGTR